MNNAKYNEQAWKKWECQLVIRDIGVNKTYTPFYFFVKYAANAPAESPWPTEFLEYGYYLMVLGKHGGRLSENHNFKFSSWSSWFAHSKYHDNKCDPNENCGTTPPIKQYNDIFI